MVSFILTSHFWSEFIPLIDLLNPDFDCSKKLLLSFVDKVTTEVYNFMSFVLNVAFVEASILSLASTGGSALGLTFLTLCVVISVKTQFLDQGKIKDPSQLIKGMSRLLQKLLKYFSGTTIS